MALFLNVVGSVPTLHLADHLNTLRLQSPSHSKHPKAVIPEPELSLTDCESDLNEGLEKDLDSIGLIGKQENLYIFKKDLYPSNELGGIVLHSAVLSGGQILFNHDFLSCCDPFDNSESASNVGVIVSIGFLHSALCFIYMEPMIQLFLFQVV